MRVNMFKHVTKNVNMLKYIKKNKTTDPKDPNIWVIEKNTINYQFDEVFDQQSPSICSKHHFK